MVCFAEWGETRDVYLGGVFAENNSENKSSVGVILFLSIFLQIIFIPSQNVLISELSHAVLLAKIGNALLFERSVPAEGVALILGICP